VTGVGIPDSLSIPFEGTVALVVDAQGLVCPLPILKAKKALSTLQAGEVLEVITTDRNAIKDFQAFCRQTGNSLLSQQQAEGIARHFLRRRD
jgi:tRNA 2-thiouridine synthesizing protein A